MNKQNEIKKMIFASLLIALGVLLPFLITPQLGGTFLPLHIPALLAGLILGPKYGLLVGFILPVFRSLITGFVAPPLFPMAVTMSFELAAFGFLTGLLKNMLPKKFFYVFPILVISMLIGRMVWGLAATLFYGLAGVPFSLDIFLKAAFVTGLPGIGIQIVLIPMLYYYLIKADLIEDIK